MVACPKNKECSLVAAEREKLAVLDKSMEGVEGSQVGRIKERRGGIESQLGNASLCTNCPYELGGLSLDF
jgi:hypothetical protein